MRTELSELRKNKGLRQIDAARLLGIPLRTYQNYETGKSTRDHFKVAAMIDKINGYIPFDENHGVYNTAQIASIIQPILSQTPVRFCFLFGSYAKGTAGPSSDVDLLVDDSIHGLDFVSLADELSTALHKKVDLIRIDSLQARGDFLNEILATGVRIYEN